MTLSLTAGNANLGALNTPLLVVALSSGAALDAELSSLDGTLGGVLARSIQRRDFRGGRDETLHFAMDDRRRKR